MKTSIRCPNCGRTARVPRQQSSSMLRCPACKALFQTPQLAPPQVAEAEEHQKRKPAGPAPFVDRETTPHTRTSPSSQLATAIKILMLTCTILWPLTMAAMTAVTFVSADRGMNVGGDWYVSDSGYTGKRSDREAGILLGSLFTGLCCPTVPYVVAMTILGVAYFAVRPSG